MKTPLLVFSMLCCLGIVYAQPAWTLKENNHWKFYQYGGLHFDQNQDPVADTSSLASMYPNTSNPGTYIYSYSSAAVSNRQGELLFYTDAYNVYDKNHEPMSNGTDLLPSNALDGTIILPALDNPDQYYIVYMSGEINFMFPSPNAYQLHYTKVDMSLNGGLGDVVTGQKNVLIANELSSQLKAVPGNDCNIWIVTHDLDSARFKAFELTSAGISTTPVLSDVGNGYLGFVGALSFMGLMDVSHDRSKIVYSQNGGDFVPIMELYDFNPGTGQLSNPVILDTLNFLASNGPMCFSPDNSKLYLAINKSNVNNHWHFISSLYQYDLNAGTPIAINNSKTMISDSISSVNLMMRIGPDGMIYIPTSYANDDTALANGFRAYGYDLDGNPANHPDAPNYPFHAYLGRIQNPNAAVNAVNFDRKAVALQPYSSAAEALGGLFVKPIPGDTNIQTTEIYLCDTGETRMVAPGDTNNVTYVEWQDGSTATERLIDSPGTYWVVSGDYCHYQIDTFIVTRELLDPQITINGFTLGTTRDYDSYQWLLEGAPIVGETDDELTVTQNGNYQVVVSNGRCIDTSAMYPVNNVGISGVHPIAGSVRIYPNPTVGSVSIDAPERVNIMVRSVEGRLLMHVQDATELSLEHVAPGLYLLYVTDSEGRPVLTEKVLKAGK